MRMTAEQVAAHQQRIKGLVRTSSAVAARVEKRTKYGNKKCEADGYAFDSAKERRRYRELRIMERTNAITALRVHPVIPLRVNGIVICEYEPDFDYNEGDKMVAEDVKSTPTKTPVYEIKRKLLFALYGIEVKEIL